MRDHVRQVGEDHWPVVNVIAMAVLVAACGGANDPLTELAASTCESAEVAISQGTTPNLLLPAAEAEVLGYTSEDLLTSMRPECPAVVLVLERIAGDAEAARIAVAARAACLRLQEAHPDDALLVLEVVGLEAKQDGIPLDVFEDAMDAQCAFDVISAQMGP